MKDRPGFQKIEMRNRETHEHCSPQKENKVLRDALLENHVRGLLTRSCFPISINHVEIIAQVGAVVKCFLGRSLNLSKSYYSAYAILSTLLLLKQRPVNVYSQYKMGNQAERTCIIFPPCHIAASMIHCQQHSATFPGFARTYYKEEEIALFLCLLI